jgi:hypothetical protein
LRTDKLKLHTQCPASTLVDKKFNTKIKGKPLSYKFLEINCKAASVQMNSAEVIELHHTRGATDMVLAFNEQLILVKNRLIQESTRL